MRRLLLTLAIATAIFVAGSLVTDRAGAGSLGAHLVLDTNSLAHNARAD